jgi:hypothetical protein
MPQVEGIAGNLIAGMIQILAQAHGTDLRLLLAEFAHAIQRLPSGQGGKRFNQALTHG